MKACHDFNLSRYTKIRLIYNAQLHFTWDELKMYYENTERRKKPFHRFTDVEKMIRVFLFWTYLQTKQQTTNIYIYNGKPSRQQVKEEKATWGLCKKKTLQERKRGRIQSYK